MAIEVDNGDLTDFEVTTDAGAVDAGTQRVTLASDDPAVASLADIKAAVEGPLAVTGPLTDTELRATAVPVSGTFFQATQPVSGTVTANLSATDNAVLDAIAASVAGTLAVAGTVDLGATDNAVLDAIAASVAAIDTDATTIIGHLDGVEGLLGTIDADTGNIATAVQLLDDAVAVLGTDTYTEATSKGLVIGAVRRDADTTLANTTNEFAPLQVDANGRLKVEAFSGETLPVSLTSTTVTGTVAVTQSGTWDEVGINDSGNSITVDAPVGTPVFVRLSDGSSAITTLPVSLASVPSHAVTNAGTFAVQVDGAALTALQLIDDSIVADDAGFTAGTTKTTVAGFVADEGSTDSVNEDDVGAARITLDRKQIIANYVHAAAGGATPHKNLDVDETEDDIKTSAGKLYWLHAVNLSNAKRYLKFYNATAANTTVGTTTPVLTFPIPTFADTNGAGFTINFGDVGIQFDTAICVAATTGFADNDTGAPSTNDVIINLGYA